MYATLTIEAIDYKQELLFTPEERYAQLTLWAQQVVLNCDAQMSTVVAEFFLGHYLKGDDGPQGPQGDDGTSAYEIYIAGGGTLSEVDFNASITDIPLHIADTDIHVTATDKSNWDEKADLDEVLKLDQTTPQTITQSPKITSLNAGRIPFANADKQLIDAVAGFFWNAATGRGSVGSATPAVKFEVVGGANSVETDVFQIRSEYTGAGTATTMRFVNSTNASDNSSSGEISVKREAAGAVMSLRIGSNAVMKELVTLLHTINFVGVDAIDPKSKLDVRGGIRCGDDTAAASADKVGTTRYRETANASYVEMCVRISATTFQWQTIITNTW